MQTRNAIGNLINKYKAVLKKCHYLNSMCSFLPAVALTGALLVGGGVPHALAATDIIIDGDKTINTTTLSTDGKITTATNATTHTLTLGDTVSTTGTVTIGNEAQTGNVNITLQGIGTDATFQSGNLTILGNSTDTTKKTTFTIGAGGSSLHKYVVDGTTSIDGTLDIKDNINFFDGGILAESADSTVNVDSAYVSFDTSEGFKPLGAYNILEGAGEFNKNILSFSHLTVDSADTIVELGGGGVAAAGTGQIAMADNTLLFVGNFTLSGQVGTQNVTLQDANLMAGTVKVGDGTGELTLGVDFTITGLEGVDDVIDAKSIDLAGKTLHLGYDPNSTNISSPGGTIDATINAMAQNSTIQVDAGHWKYEGLNAALGSEGTLHVKGGTFEEVSDTGVTRAASEFKIGGTGIVMEGGTYYSKNLTLEHNSEQNLNIIGTVKADILVVNNSSGGSDDLTINSGTLEVTQSLVANTITLNGDDSFNTLNLEVGSSTAVLNADVVANGNIAAMSVQSGNWTAKGDITLTKGTLTVGLTNTNITASLDLQGQTLTTTALNGLVIVGKGSSLNLDLSNMGTITENNNAFSPNFTDSDIAADTFTNSGKVVFYSDDQRSMTVDAYKTLVNDIKAQLDSDDSTQGTYGISNVTFTDAANGIDINQAYGYDLASVTAVVKTDDDYKIKKNQSVNVGWIEAGSVTISDIIMESGSSVTLNGDRTGTFVSLVPKGVIDADHRDGRVYLDLSHGSVDKIDLTKDDSTSASNFDLTSHVTLSNVTVTGSVLQDGDSISGSTNYSTLVIKEGISRIEGEVETEQIIAKEWADLKTEGNIDVKNYGNQGDSGNEGSVLMQKNSMIKTLKDLIVEKTVTLAENVTLHVEGEFISNVVENFDAASLKIDIGAYANSGQQLTKTGANSEFIFETLQNTKELALGENSTFTVNTTEIDEVHVKFTELTVSNSAIIKAGTNEGLSDLTITTVNSTNTTNGVSITGKNITIEKAAEFGEDTKMEAAEDLDLKETIKTGVGSVLKAGGNITIGDENSTNNDVSTILGEIQAIDELDLHTNVALGDSKVDTSGQTVATAEKISMNQKSTILDPVWRETSKGSGIYNPAAASQLAVADLATNGLDGNVAVGQNSHFSIGTKDPTIMTAILKDDKKHFGTVKWGPGGITAAVGLFGTTTHKIDSAGGTLIVDGQLDTMTPNARGTSNTEFSNSKSTIKPYTITGGTGVGNAIFANESLLVIREASAFNSASNFALAGTDGKTGTITVAAGARLHVENVTANQEIYVADFGSGTFDGWDATEVTTNNPLLGSPEAKIGANDATYVVTFSSVDVGEVFPCLDESMQGLINNMAPFDVNSPNPGIKFVSRVLDNTGTYGYGPANAAEAAAVIESAAQPAALTGVARTTMDVEKVRSNAITTRASQAHLGDNGKEMGELHLAKDGQVTSGENIPEMEEGLGLWVAPQFDNLNTFGNMCNNCSDNGYSTDLGGMTVGADYTFNEDFKAGLAVSLGGGKTITKGEMLKTENSFYYWGISLYGSYHMDDFTIMTDVGYSQTINDISQRLPGSLQMGSNSVDVNAHVFSVGLTAEYVFKTDFMDIIPHAGVRYMSVYTDAYDVENGGTLFEVDADQQSVWYFPVGVTFQNDIAINENWTFTPKIDLGFVAAAGDLHVNSHASIPGINYTSDLELQNVDGFAFKGGLGFDISGENLKFSLTYNIQASEHETAHGLHGMLSYEF